MAAGRIIFENVDTHAWNLTAQQFTPPANFLTSDTMVAAAMRLDDGKYIQRYRYTLQQRTGLDIATETRAIHIANASGAVLSVKTALTGVAATGDRTVSVDLHKGNASTAFSTMLTAAVSLAAADALRTAKAGTFASTTFALDDILQLVVTLGGTTGTIPQGLIIAVTVKENPS